MVLAVLLGVVMFLVLFFLFSKKPNPPEPQAGRIAVVEEPPKPQPEPAAEKFPPTDPPSTGAAAEGKKEDFTFFKTLKEKAPPAPLQPEKPLKAAEPSIPVAVPREIPKAEKPKPAAPKRSEEKRYTIQVAALNVERPANELAEKLKQRGFPSYVIAARRPEVGTVYRVRVGRFSTLAEAKEVAERIRKTERLNFFITLAEG
jgi:cell division septation protein DedD